MIAFYLPQFHPIPENDAWWGPGFTEWRNVVAGRPRFRGHYQPHLPADLGFYDLRLAESRQAQADLARQYGIEGFCYWHYWFNGKRLLERPFDEVLRSGQPDFPFCLAWANESWTRRWDGAERQVLQAQEYGGEADDRAHFQALLPAFQDRRALQVDKKPIFLIYRPATLPHPAATLALWRREAVAAGLPGLHILAVETFYSYRLSWRADLLESMGIHAAGWQPYPAVDWTAQGFDGVVLFQPNPWAMRPHWARRGLDRAIAGLRDRVGGLARRGLQDAIFDYTAAWHRVVRRTPRGDQWFPCVMPSWDNSARRQNSGATIFKNASPASYEAWLNHEIARIARRPPDRRLVFVNAWNEWAEGCHLEPDLHLGHAYLEATRRAVGEPALAPHATVAP